MILQRRNFLFGLGSLMAAPAIVRAESIMKVRALPMTSIWMPDDIPELWDMRLVLRDWNRFRYLSDGG